jgi:hypothetical protein
MPSELVVPAFALVLAANAILIALAIRTFAVERDTGSRDRQADAPAAPTAEPAGLADDPSPVVSAPPEPAAAPVATAISTAEPAPHPAAAIAPTRSTRRSRGSRATTAASGRRQRFAMPQLDEDHERFNRSISTFLSGGKRSDGE